jgi:hypothetical protein
MKTILKINKIFILFVFFFLCTNISLYAQTTIKKEFRFTINYVDVAKFQKDLNVGVKGNGNGKTIKVSVFSAFNYFPNDNANSDSFLFGFKNDNKTLTYINDSFANVTRPTWDPFILGDRVITSFNNLSFASNDLTFFKNKVHEITSKSGSFFNSLSDESLAIVLRIEVTGVNPDLSSAARIVIPGVSEFNPNDVATGTIKVYRGSATIPVQTINLSSIISGSYKLVTFQGDKVVFEADPGTKPNVENLTDTNVMRWAGESLFIHNRITNLGEIKPFLFFDSNVHGVKMRKYPKEWRINDKNKYPKFVLADDKLRLSWIANGRYEFNDFVDNTIYDLNLYLKNYKERGQGQLYPNSNKFFGTPAVGIKYQRNNQKEGLNMELLNAYFGEQKFIAGLDPDELIYKDFNTSKIVGNPITGKTFNYVDKDQWKVIDDKEREGMNNPMFTFLTKTGQFISGNNQYLFSGYEIVDTNLYTRKSGSTTIAGKQFNYSDEQPMFNNKVPVYYNDSFNNKPDLRASNLKFIVDGKVFTIELAVLSPLEGKRKSKEYDQLTAQDRKNSVVNFYGIINGPIHVARFQKNVTYGVSNLPNFNELPGVFSLVYTFEDSYGILTEKRKTISSEDPRFSFDFNGGGYHDITLRYKRNKNADNDEEVIVAGKELIDIDLRFIFSPNAEDANDFSFNAPATFGNTLDRSTFSGNIRLNENKANGKHWFLDNNNKLLNSDYGLSHGYKDHSVVRTYVMDRDEVMTLTVLDADPHAFTHYQPDFYLSERRLSKRLSDADLGNKNGFTKIEWFAAKNRDFTDSNKSIGFGRYCTIAPKEIYKGIWFSSATYKGPIYIKAVYNNTSDIRVKIVQQEVSGSVKNIIDKPDMDLGSVGIYNLSSDQFNLLQKITKNIYTKKIDSYRIYKVENILSSYTYGEKGNSTNETAKRYKPDGMTDEVGEHKRFSDENNYDARFKWTFRHPTKPGVVFKNDNLFFDFNDAASYNAYVANFQNVWFPQDWVRHLDSPVRSPEIPGNGADFVKKFNQNQSAPLESYINSGATTYEPWQVRLPWIAQTGLDGYKTRWNIKCIYDIKKLFNRSQIGKAYDLPENAEQYGGNVIGQDGVKIVPNFDSYQREMQEFYMMLRNKEIVIVDTENLNNVTQISTTNTASTLTVGIRIADSGNVEIYDGIIQKQITSQHRIAQPKNEESASIVSDSGLCTVYPNPNSLGIFKVDINVPQENSQVQLQLSDLTGKIIYSSLPQTVNDNFSATIGENLNLPKGVYLLTIKINDFVTTKKLVVN